MVDHKDISSLFLCREIRSGRICLGGNKRLKIYGKLDCVAGKRMKRKNRVFFKDEDEALLEGSRPCGNCMSSAYKNWKNGIV